MNEIGYFIYDSNKLGIAGQCYNYHWGGNGVFIEAKNAHLELLIPVALGITRGLPEIKPTIKLRHGLIPYRFIQFIIGQMKNHPEGEELYVISWRNENYIISRPNQIKLDDITFTYEPVPDTIMEIHSHPGNKGISFSAQDDEDESGLKIYGVISDLEKETPSALLRAGAYGHFLYINWKNVFIAYDDIPTPHKFREDINWKNKPYDQNEEIAANMRDFWRHFGSE